MSRVFAMAAVVVWAIGAVALPILARTWWRGRRSRWMLVGFAGGLVAQIAWLVAVADGGLASVLDPETDVGLAGWAAWALGVGGVAGLLSGLESYTKRGPDALRDPDRAFEIAIGLFGLGILLQQVARAL